MVVANGEKLEAKIVYSLDKKKRWDLVEAHKDEIHFDVVHYPLESLKATVSEAQVQKRNHGRKVEQPLVVRPLPKVVDERYGSRRQNVSSPSAAWMNCFNQFKLQCRCCRLHSTNIHTRQRRARNDEVNALLK